MKYLIFVLLLVPSAQAQLLSVLFPSKQDIPSLCEKTLNTTFAESNKLLWKIPEEVLHSGQSELIKSGVLKSVLAISDRYPIDWSPWLMQNVADPAVPEAGLKVQTFFAERMLARLNIAKSPALVLEESATKPTLYSEAARLAAEQVIAKFKTGPIHPGLAEVKKRTRLLCVQYLDPFCASAVNELIDFVAPRMVSARKNGVVYIAILPVFEKLLTDPKFVQGLALATKTMNSSSTLFDDINRGFLQSGLTPQQASTYTWDIIGFYGIRGASMSLFEDIINPETAPLWNSLYLFSAKIGIMDSKTYKTGNAYSYPKEVQSYCGFDRPYHFWFGAYLSHYLRQKGYPIYTSVVATHLLAKLYEFGVSHGTRDPNRIYRETYGSNFQTGIQTAIAFNDAGALWGAGIRHFGLNPDIGLQQMLGLSGPLPEMTKEELDAGIKDDATRYLWFHRLIAPDAYFVSLLPLLRF